MRPKNILLFYKASAYEIYLSHRLNILGNKINPVVLKHIRRSRQAHQRHYASLHKIEEILKKYKISYVKRCRGKTLDFRPYDVVMTVGGDGTFLEAARGVCNQLIVGINSNPEYSVGKLCVATAHNFEDILQSILKGNFKTMTLPRLRLKLDKQKTVVDVANDILVCHKNPAMMCRYCLKVGRRAEVQRSSGVWVATTAGSSGAIQSAGGKLLRMDEKKFQYMPRELYDGNKGQHHLRGGILNLKGSISLTSLMTGGVIFIDGAHFSFPFEYGSTLKIFCSPIPIKTIKL